MIYGGIAMIYVGIDVSKDNFDIAILNDENIKNHQFRNNSSGFKSMLKKLKLIRAGDRELLFTMEATGIYSLDLAKYLYSHKQKVIVVNPLKTHAFLKMEMSRNKTDKTDAIAIAKYSKYLDDSGQLEKSLFIPKSDIFESLQFLVTRLEQLSGNKTQESNRLEAAKNKVVIRSLKRSIKSIELEIKKINKAISDIVEKDNDLKEDVHLLESINGLGFKTSCAILAYIGDVSMFKNSKQITSYAGLHPRIEQSGTSINRSSLSKLGNKRLRKALFMPALVAVRYNPLLKKMYERLLAKGKAKKLAIVAVMRKLLVLAYGVLKSRKYFDPNYCMS
jgi:transposase